MKKILIVFGTRPEAIKMCPLVIEFRKNPTLYVEVCVTGQHQEMLNQVLTAFNISPDFDLHVMKENQTLFDVTNNIIHKMRILLKDNRPDLVIVHGDTTTTFATALASFYYQIPVAHIEAGLRSHDILSPYPEEFNRRAVTLISILDFAPTALSRDNLIKDGKNPSRIFVTGNTAIDALKTTVKEDYTHEEIEWAKGYRLIVLTAHRRENLGKPMVNIFRAVSRLVMEYPDVKVLYPIHLNPVIRKLASEELFDNDRVHIIEPLDVVDFHNILARCYLILTDSGGIQEEAPSLGIPVLVLRDITERPEGVEAGTLKLVGTDMTTIYQECKKLLDSEEEYFKMTKVSNPYGDGFACERIVEVITKYDY